MKKLVIASAAMGGAALIAFGASGTFAAFTDQASSSPSSAGAASLYMTPGSVRSSDPVGLAAMVPGNTAGYALYVGNGGTLPGALTPTFVVASDLENTCLPSETRGTPVDESCDDSVAFAGEFADAALVSVSYTAAASADECKLPAKLTAGTETMSSANNKSAKAQTVQPKAGLCAVVTVSLPKGADNTVQGDVASFRIDYRLDQVTGGQLSPLG